MIKPEPGFYAEPVIIELDSNDLKYSLDGKKFFPYVGPFLLEHSTTVYVLKGEMLYSYHFEISETGGNTPGDIFIIGGADKSVAIHQAIVDSAGGAENVRIAFVPAGSANPYAAGMDRWVRFEHYCRLTLNYEKVPQINGKYDFSNLNNHERFWIVPVALIDDPYTNAHPTNDPEHVINDESTYPDINESLWINGSTSVEVAQKLLKGNYHVIFLTGGNQARYVALFFYPDGRETLLLQVIKYLHRKGAVIAGTSAGAASLSKLMLMSGGSAYSWMEEPYIEKLKDEIADPEDFPVTRKGLILGRGLGIISANVIIDTHFSQRGRQGRLLRAIDFLSKNTPDIWGIGIDEDTAAVLSQNELRVVGSGTVFLARKKNSSTFLVHCLSHGDSVTWSENKLFNVQSISFEGTKISIQSLPEYLVEPDIFGKNKFNDLVQKQLLSESSSIAYGLTLNDRDENSSDEYPDITMQNFLHCAIVKKTADSSHFQKHITIRNFGHRDKDFPLIQEKRVFRLSCSHIELEIKKMNLLHVPDFLHRAPSIRECFSESKETVIGLLAHKTDNEWTLHLSFFDYAYDEDSKSLIMLTEPCEKGMLMLGDKKFLCDENGFCRINLTDLTPGSWKFLTKGGSEANFQVDRLSDMFLVFSNETL